MKRFYKAVSVSAAPYQILLDGKAVKTPMRLALTLPSQALAEAVAEEWRGQGEEIKPDTMPLTKLANTALDRVSELREEVIHQIAAYANDNLCYRADAPADLAARQKAEWDPLLKWAEKRYGVSFEIRSGVTHFSQSFETVEALYAALTGYDDFALAALHNAATILASLVLTLALAEQRLSAEEAFALSQLEERYQAEQWGEDEEAAQRTEALRTELIAAETFLRLAKL
ncbi:chaperone required for assembly of F1-ATPase [Rhizomicrobium palustre]|uniref:Chaperone required for assembly of F1-ATPase n=1 Tax=Rhizomicrobium palustre TaxID=189966 RepID=A0A846N4Z1_9PROT|nr:ATP12 family protein [Rhizomicrobium palustre]NIK90252.1 chaperone required for assembly of F1-ATPase [Rhizomicrobium palustre]